MDSDQELGAVALVGVGGAAQHVVRRASDARLAGVRLVHVSAKDEALAALPADEKILLHASSAAPPSSAFASSAAALEAVPAIESALRGSRLVLVYAGLGGGTGSGAAPVVVETARRLGTKTLAVVTMPFSFEGSRRCKQAKYALEQLDALADRVVAVRNDDLLASGHLLSSAFERVDQAAVGLLAGIGSGTGTFSAIERLVQEHFGSLASTRSP